MQMTFLGHSRFDGTTRRLEWTPKTQLTDGKWPVIEDLFREIP